MTFILFLIWTTKFAQKTTPFADAIEGVSSHKCPTRPHDFLETFQIEWNRAIVDETHFVYLS